MRNKIICPNPSCSSQISFKQDVIKLGKLYLKASKTYNQRYKCKLCKKTFCNSIFTKKVPKEKHYDLRKKVEGLYCTGNTLRDIAKLLAISKTTVESKMLLLAMESFYFHHVSGKFVYKNVKHHHIDIARTPLIVFDEMETHESTVLKPISIGIAYDYHNKKIVAIETATFKPRGTYKKTLELRPDLKEEYGYGTTRLDTRTLMIESVFAQVKTYLSTSPYAPRIITDGKKSYVSSLKAIFGTSFEHIVIVSNGDITIDDLEPAHILEDTGLLKDPEELRGRMLLSGYMKVYKADPKMFAAVSAMATFNKLCATMRAKIAVLARSSFVHTKSIEHLQEGLYVYQYYWNKRHLAETPEEFQAKIDLRIKKKENKRLKIEARRTASELRELSGEDDLDLDDEDDEDE